MYLETFGKLIFSRFRPPIFYLLLFVPLFFTLLYVFMLHNNLNELEEELEKTLLKGKPAIERKLRMSRFIKMHSHADPYFLDRHIESMSFLENEKKQIQSLLDHPALSDRRVMENRLEFINNNKISFSEENLATSGIIKETEEKQRSPVQVDINDLENFCAHIENRPVGIYTPKPNIPQFIFLDFKIKKAPNPFHFNNYELQTQILKREWIH